MLDSVLLLLRVLSSACLLAFLAVLAYSLWRDVQVSLQRMQHERRSYGRLLVLNKLDQEYLPSGQAYPLLPLTSIGRSPSNSIVIDQHYASSEHALIALRSGQWWLEDRNSRNGTLLNGDAVTQATILSEGDIIGIGNIYLRLTLDEEKSSWT